MRFTQTLTAVLVMLSWPQLGRSDDADPQALAQKAKQLLQAYCHRCHGEQGSVEGGVNYMLDRQQLVARRKIVPGNPAKSALLKRIRDGEMPPEDEKQRPSDAEVSQLKEWIQQGAPDFNPSVATRRFVTTDAVWQLIWDDLSTQGNFDRRFKRYVSIVHLYNAGFSGDELETYRQGISKLLNSLSWSKNIAVPKAIDPAGTILRIDLRDYKWDDKTWSLLASAYAYGVLPAGELPKNCVKATGTPLPQIRGDWLAAAAAHPPLYHEILQLPATVRDLEKELRVDVSANLREGLALRAAFNGSGVSRNNRLIERHETLFGAYWKSYDFAGNTGKQNLFASPLGPQGHANSFRHDGGELIFSLPNGLQAYMLVDARGDRLDKGPTEIVSDPRRPDRAVVNGLSCMSCHSRGIIFKDDQVRPHVEQNKQFFLKDEFDSILSLYVPREKMQAAMRADANRFRVAVEKAGCRSGTAEPIAAMALRLEAEMDLALVASELGLPAAELQKQFRSSITLARLLGPLAVAGGTIQRQVFTEAFATLIGELELGTPLPVTRRIIEKWSSPPTTLPAWTAPTWAGNSATLPWNRAFSPLRMISTPSVVRGDHLMLRFSEHQSKQLHTLAISPADARFVAWESKIGMVAVYDRNAHNVVAHMVGHEGNVLSVDFAPTGKLLATGSMDQTARVWNVENSTEALVLRGHSAFVQAVKFSPNEKLLATGSERVRLWAVDTGEPKLALPKLPHWVEGLAFSPDGAVIAAASKAGIRIWDVTSGKELAALVDGEATCVAFSPDGKTLVGGGTAGSVRIWDWPSPKVRTTIKAHDVAVSSVTFSPNGKILVSSAGATRMSSIERGEVKAWNVADNSELASFNGFEKGASCAAVTPDGKELIGSGWDGTVRIWNLLFLRKTELQPFEGHTQHIMSFALSPDGSLAITGSADGSARLWDMKTGAEVAKLIGHDERIDAVVVTPDRKSAFTTAYKSIAKWDVATGKKVSSIKQTHRPTEMALSRDGKLLATANYRWGVCLWDVETEKKVHDFQFKYGTHGLAFSPDAKHLVVSESQRGVCVLDAATGQQVRKLGTLRGFYPCIEFSADGKQLLFTEEKGVFLVDVESGKEIRRFSGHKGKVQRATLSPDGQRILSSSGPLFASDSTELAAIILHDAATGREINRWEGDAFLTGSVAFAGDDAAFYLSRLQLRKLILEPGGRR